jgi:hypothetical protein
MNATTKQHNWTAFLKLFSEQNNNRPTRLGVYKREFDTEIDYWIEDNLPLAGIDVDAPNDGAPTIEIMLGDAAKPDSHHLTHAVAEARFVKIVLSVAGSEADGLEIEDAAGKTTVLRFEN